MDSIWAGMICLTLGVVYLLNLRKETKDEEFDKLNSFSKSLRFQGIVGGSCLIIIGIIIIYRDLS